MNKLLQTYSMLCCILLFCLPSSSLQAKVKKQLAQTASQKTKKKNVTLSEMSFEELQEAKNNRLAKKDKEGAIRYLEKMVTTCKDKDDLALVLMELADLFFDTGKLAQAEKLYEQFYTLYPGNQDVEKAQYKAILCSYYLTLDSDRDQTKTHETLTMANSFLDRKDIFKTYVQDVSSIQQKCNEKLCQSELDIAKFYLNRGKEKDLIAAQQRLESIRKDYSEKIPSLEPRILVLEIEHATKTKNTVRAEERRTLLAQRFPDYAATRLASNSRDTSFIDRF